MGLFTASVSSQNQLPQRLRQTATTPAHAPTPEVASDIVSLSEPSPKPTPSKLSKAYNWAKNLVIPSNFPNSVSKDYAVTRKWQLTRDTLGAISWGFAASMAISSATVPGLAALGLTLFSYNLIKDRLNQVVGFLTSAVTPMASRNPRAWGLGSDILDSAGVAALSCVALAPQYFVPISIGVGLMQTFAGTMRGAANADIGRRQAIADNLGEVNAKNGNQGLIVSNLGLLAGGLLSKGLQAALGAYALPVIGAATAAAGLYATGRMLANLDMHPVNESALRQIAASLESGESVPGPDREGIWKSLPGIWKSDKIELGQDPELLKKDPVRYAELKSLYADKNYLLEAVNGQPYVVIKQESSPEDRFQAVLQAVTLERLRDSQAYQTVLAQDGQDKADFWLVEQSLNKTPRDVKPLLEKIQDAGWSTDMLRFLDSGFRPKPEEL